MRIFMLVQHPDAGGPVSKHGFVLVDALRSLGCTVVTHPWGRRSPDEPLSSKLTQRLRDVASIGSAVRREPFDVAVVKTSHDWRTLARDCAVVPVLRSRCPTVLQLHGSRAHWLDAPGHRAFKLATAALLAAVDGVLVLSTEEQRQWQSFRARPPVVPVKNPYVRNSHLEGAHPANPPRLLFVGRLLTEKGIFELVDAFADVGREVESELVLVGGGPQERALRERIRARGLEDRVALRGHLTGPELAEEYRAATAFVLPSWSEGFPTVLAEAMDAGLPIVTTRIRGAADHLVDGEHALFVEPRDVAGLTQALVTVLRDSELRARMAAANRKRVAMFAPDAVAAEFVAALESMLRARSA
jgi:glycosyltransferase involved in cell wall biosynthesis